jgi:hypothetical protein
MHSLTSAVDWRTLATYGTHRALGDEDGAWWVSAKASDAGTLMIRVASDEAGWSHLLLGPDLTVLAQSYGREEVDSFGMLRKILATKYPDNVATSEITAEIDGAPSSSDAAVAKLATQIRERISERMRPDGVPGARSSVSANQIASLARIGNEEQLLERLGLTIEDARKIATTGALPGEPRLRERLRDLGREYVELTGATGYRANKFLGQKLLASVVALAVAAPRITEASDEMTNMASTDTAKRISIALQELLRRENMIEIEAVPAAKALDRLGILADSRDRPGLPLRRYLRDGLIDGQLQEPNGRWLIRRVAD